VLKREIAKRLRVKLYILNYRHIAVDIRRKKVSQIFSKEYNNEVEEIEEKEIDNSSKDIIEL
jgi:hypothetical protein